MKKAAIILVTVVFIALLASSCKTREKCPAYGEAHKFQVEKSY